MADAGVTTAATAAVVPSSTDDGVVVLTTADVAAIRGAVFCPNPRMPLWNHHPRVFIDVATTGEGRCPYCGTTYRLSGGAAQGH